MENLHVKAMLLQKDDAAGTDSLPWNEWMFIKENRIQIH